MAKTCEYLVCLVQKSRVTFVNGEWQGERPLDLDRPDDSLDSCPRTWEFLQQVGARGWELVGVGYQTEPGTEVEAQVLYLRLVTG